MAFGLLNINKPSGPTSHDIVAQVRQGTGERRIGHAGTLDPLAEGVLVLALGQATRLVEYLMSSHKSYDARLTLGVTTDTYDTEGEIVARKPIPPDLTLEYIETTLASFRGEILQTPPVYSAIKVKGRSAHARARAGEDVQLEPRWITIHTLHITRFDLPTLELSIECSAGTYIRSLAHDLGEELGCGATLSGLTRTASGDFRLENAIEFETLLASFEDGLWQDHLLPADLALQGTPQVKLNQIMLERIQNGIAIPATDASNGLGRAYAPDGRFVAVLLGDVKHGLWRPRKVFTNIFL